MNILALDTCTEMCSAALLLNGKLYQRAELTQRGHSEKILGMMDALLAEAGGTVSDIELVAFGRGPGSFTGVRIGVGVAQGIAFARDLPVAAVSSLAAVAQTVMDKHQVSQVAVAMDARMGEVYAAFFKAEAGLAQLVDKEQVCTPDQFKPLDDTHWFAAGTGWQAYETMLMDQFNAHIDGVEPEAYPQAAAIIKLAQHMAETNQLVAADQAMPVYLRDNVAKKKGAQS
jgi:tRNA threonylcarbamoyladenosine biosynthesis protein TsaB